MSSFALIVAGSILFAAAIAFLVAELFTPTHGILGFFAVCCAVGGVVAYFYASPVMGAISAAALVVIGPVAMYYAIKLYPTSPVGKKVMLKAPDGESTRGFAREAESLAALTGRRGVAASSLRPAGTVDIDGQLIDCVSEGDVVEAGKAVEVVRVTGMKVIVKAVEG